MEPVIHLRAVVSLLGRFPALAGIDLDVGRGEVVVVHGPNGAGKTTLLRLCAGVQAPSAGTARVLGSDLAGVTARRHVRRRIGLLGHASALYDELTVADNVEFWARTAGVPDHEARAAMARMGVDGRLASVTASRLSAGQRRRASLACLVARRPELWLLDEPHAGLDSEGRDRLDALVEEAARAGATVLVASHEHDRTAGLSSRVITVEGGVVVDDSGAGGTAPTAVETGQAAKVAAPAREVHRGP